jgi:hypothetical protein
MDIKIILHKALLVIEFFISSILSLFLLVFLILDLFSESVHLSNLFSFQWTISGLRIYLLLLLYFLCLIFPIIMIVIKIVKGKSFKEIIIHIWLFSITSIYLILHIYFFNEGLKALRYIYSR